MVSKHKDEIYLNETPTKHLYCYDLCKHQTFFMCKFHHLYDLCNYPLIIIITMY